MLISAVISLQAARDWLHRSPAGRAAQAWFLEQVSRWAPDLAAQMHAEPGLRPYTLSALMDANWQMIWERSEVPASQPVFLRLTSLSAPLSELLQEKLLPNLPGQVRLNETVFKILGWSASPDEHPWAGQHAYGDLVRITQDLGFNKLQYCFNSPTAFRSEGSDIPLPVPGSILRSWWHKWNAFAPDAMKIDPSWPLFADACVLVSRFERLSTRRWEFADGSRGGATGFVGDVELALLPRSRAREWQAVWPGSRHVLHTLSQFALYCGTGHHTTIGMGQTRLIPRNQDEPVFASI